MTLLEIKAVVAAYFGKTLAELTFNGNDLFLAAANQVRRLAELTHDFEFTRRLVTVTVNGVTGGSLDSAVLYGTATAVDIKTILEMGLFDEDANLRPVEWTTVAESLERQRTDLPQDTPRYPTDEWYSRQPAGGGRFTLMNNSLYRFPKDADNNFSVGMEVYAFTDDWDADDLDAELTDTWTKYAAQFIQWGTMIHLNHYYKEFVFRQEGNLGPPKEVRDEGLAAFITWDAARYEQHRRRGR